MDNYSAFAVELIPLKVDFKQIPTLASQVIPFPKNKIEKYNRRMTSVTCENMDSVQAIADKMFSMFINMEATNEERLQVYIDSILILLDGVSSEDNPQPAVRALEYRFSQR